MIEWPNWWDLPYTSEQADAGSDVHEKVDGIKLSCASANQEHESDAPELDQIASRRPVRVVVVEGVSEEWQWIVVNIFHWNPSTVFAEINAHPENKRPPKNSDFLKGGVHKTDGFWWVIFQRGEYTKPMGFGMFFYCF